MSSFPLVSVVTPSYNQGRFIRDTIESVLSQDYPNLEYIVIDGGSTDDTLSILQSYGNRFFWLSERDRGQANAINKGLRLAKGEILAWLNSDDVYLPGAIATAVRFLLRHPEAGMLYGEAAFIDESGREIARYPTEPFDLDHLVDVCYICQPATFLRRRVLEDAGFLDEKFDMCMDYDLWIKIARRHVITHCPVPLAQSRLHSECKTMRQRAAFCREVLGMLNSHYGFVPPSWVGCYARALLEQRLDRSVGWQNALFLTGVVAICAREYLRYNLRMPLVELKRWIRGIRQGLTKLPVN